MESELSYAKRVVDFGTAHQIDESAVRSNRWPSVRIIITA